MSTDSNGVVSWKVTRITMINAVRDAHPAPAGRLRRQKRLTHAELADAILLNLAPEAEPASLKVAESAERIIAARDAEIAGLKDDHYALIRAKNAEIEGLREALAQPSQAAGEARARAGRAEAELARVAAALAPLTVTTGMTHAERALAAGVIRDSISRPAADAGMIP